MSRSLVQILLLFFLSSGTAQAPDPSIAAIWNELNMLRGMMHDLGTNLVEQRVELRTLENRVKVAELQAAEEKTKVLLLTAELENTLDKVEEQRVEMVVAKNKMAQLEKENAVLTAELAANEKDLDNQRGDVAALRGALSTAETQMQVQKIIVEDLEKAKTEQETRLNAADVRMTANEKDAEEQKVEVVALRANLNNTVTQLHLQHNDIEQLQKETGGKFAFSVGLNSQVGPYNTETTLKYNKILTNIGNVYNPILGKFIAPVRGVYYFRFTAFDYRIGQFFGLHLYRNSQKLMINWKYNKDEVNVYLSNALTLQLEKGDLVYMLLPSGYALYDNEDNHNTFSGFLLFSL